jgi:hypothetical protein
MTGTLGLTRHLTPGEIAGQVDLLMEDTGFAPNHFNIVFMGMGEPFHNYDGTGRGAARLTSSDGFAIGAKRITVSTAGMAPEIERLAGEDLRVRLALSLSATTDEARSALFPINRRYPIARLMEACRAWGSRTGEKVFLEYVLLGRRERYGPGRGAAGEARARRRGADQSDSVQRRPRCCPHRATPWSGVTRFRDALGRARVPRVDPPQPRPRRRGRLRNARLRGRSDARGRNRGDVHESGIAALGLPPEELSGRSA